MNFLWDYSLFEWIQVHLINKEAIHFFYVLSQPILIIIPLLFVLLYLSYIDRKNALIFLVLIIITILFSETLAASIKALVTRPRPKMAMFHHINFTTFSLPSAHATNTSAILTIIYLFFNLGKPMKYLFVASALLVSIGRVITAHHFISDIAVGLLCGFSLAQLLYFFYKRYFLRIM